jgi:phage FluMu protein Com
MKIECPHCQELNQIEFAEYIKCSKCEKSLKGYNYRKFSKLVLSASSAIVIGAIGGYKANGYMDDVRYPLEVEYSIVDTCVNSSGNAMSISWYKNKRDICLCALESSMSDVSYSDYKSDKTAFMTAFKRNANSCQ